MSISSEGDERPISQRHSSIPTVTEFRDAFWGDGGLDILLQNTKQANNASKELEGFVRDRAKAEEQIGKDLQKAAKHNAQVGAHIGAFAPAWMELVCAYSDKVALAHLSLASKLMELAKEISAYHNHQKEQYRLSKDQAVTPCAEALSALEQTTSHANKCKVMYHQAHHQACELVEHLSKINREAHKQKDLEKLESRLKKADSHAQQSESDYKASLQKQETARQDFRDKMTVLADRLQKTEMEHLSQMKKFVATILTVERKMESTVEFVKKHQDKETTLSAEVMLQQFVAVRGSGTTLAPALKFEPPPTEMPVLPAVSALTGQVQSSSSLPSVSPDPGSDAASAKKKWLRKKKKKEKGKGEKEGDTPSATPGPEASVDVDVDEEGYSIRPDNADRVGSKDDKDSDFSYGSDSDEPETESKLRSISIRPVNATQDKAISDNSSDLTAAVQSLSILKPVSACVRVCV
ncbi:F-BAR domain only protein 2-like [Sycon ciliatum]|uniref:F-BAR domain only protein 2-like n=1 Tax=Sycon ciliatum TaxID=27933 RepID=UPI0031F6144C